MLYDARGREIWACPNVDSRAGEEAGELVRTGAAQEIYDRSRATGSRSRHRRASSGSRSTSRTSSPRSPTSGMLGDWILTRLSGAFATDPSLGSSSGMFELAERDWSERVLELVRPRAIGLPACRRVGHGRRRRHRRGRGRDGPARGHARRRRRRRHTARPARHRRHPAGPVHDRRRQLLAGDGRPRRAADRPASAPPHALPHRPRPLDDGRDRLLLRDRHALVPRRVLRARGGRGAADG